MNTKTMGRLKVEDEAEGRVSAVFATLEVIDHDGDVTKPGAFADNGDVRISAYNHASWGNALPVGKGKIHEDGDEAILEGQFFMDTQHGADTFTVVKEMGDLQEWSYGFDILKASFGEEDDQEVQYLEKLKVHEVSPVILGAGLNTRTLSAKGKSEKLSDEIEAVLADLDSVTARVAEVVAMRAAKGKSLGEESQTLMTRLESSMERLTDLMKVEPQNDETRVAVVREVARYERLRANL